MKYFHSPSPTPRRMREPFTKRRGPGPGWRAHAERPKSWLSPGTRGTDGRERGEGDGWHGKCCFGERQRQFALVPSGRRIWRLVSVTVVTEPHQSGDGLIAFTWILGFFKSVFESWCRGDRVPQANARPCGVRRCKANSRCGIHSIHGHFGRLVFDR